MAIDQIVRVIYVFDEICGRGRYRKTDWVHRMFDRLTKLAAATALVAGVAGGAQAQGLGEYNGPYAGLFIGWGTADREANGVEEEANGFDLGGFVGYELRQERMYYSGELEISLSDKEDNVIERGVSGFVNGRVGYFLSDGTLIYGLAGLGFTNFESSNSGQDEDVLGYRIGIGAEFRATETISVRPEIAYTIYDNDKMGTGTEQDVDDLTFRVGGVYRFQL